MSQKVYSFCDIVPPYHNVHCLVNIRGWVNINLFLADMAAYIEWRERRKRFGAHRIGCCPSFDVEFMKSPLATEPKGGDFLSSCQSSDSIRMYFKLFGDLPHCIRLVVTVFHWLPIRFVTNDNKLVIKIIYKNRRNVPKNGYFGPSEKRALLWMNWPFDAAYRRAMALLRVNPEQALS